MAEVPFPPTEQVSSGSVLDLSERFTEPVLPPGPADTRAPVEAEAEAPEPPALPELRSRGEAVVAEVDGRKVGEARLVPTVSGWGARVYVHPAWRRRGLGLRLLRGVVDLATGRGIGELDVRLDAADLAGLRLVLASGLCGSISCDAGETRTRLVLARGGATAETPAQR